MNAQPAEPPTDAQAQPVEQSVLATLTDGRTFEGVIVTEDDTNVRLRTATGEITLARSLINDLAPLEPLEIRYERMRQDIPADDVPARLNLARWLRDRRAYALALTEADTVLAIEPFNVEAIRLRRWLDQQMKFDLVRRPEPADPDDADPDDRRHPERRKRVDFPLVDLNDVNLIRVYEIDLRNPPRMQIDRRDIDAFLDAYADHELVPRSVAARDALVRGAPSRVLDLMFRTQARDFYNRARVIDDPASIEAFRDNIHNRWLIPRCATTECHGGADAGRLYLYNKRGNADTTVYTNFIILDRYILDDGTPLINHEKPEESPLIQMALSRDLSDRPHPRVDARRGRADWKPVFVDARQATYNQAIAWIRSLYQPRPRHPIDYQPPAPSEPLAQDIAPVER